LIFVKVLALRGCDEVAAKERGEMNRDRNSAMLKGRLRRPLAGMRLIGTLCAHLLTAIAALMLATGGANAAPDHRPGDAGGFVMVICADGVAKTVVFDHAGDPVETPDGQICDDRCVCCTVSASDPLLPAPFTPERWKPTARPMVLARHPASLGLGCGHGPNARGPPSEEDA
jgi:hypothetical protein